MSHSWLAIELPHLALDLVTRGQPAGSHIPVAISDAAGQRPRVLDSNPAALHLGVRAGLPVNAALALAEGLCLHARDPAAETAALHSLAAWCYQYSSLVSIHGDKHTLLLEAGASERLFGASSSLAGRLSAELLELGYHSRIGIGPGPASACLAARQGLALHNQEQLQAALDTLPLSALNLCAAQQAALDKMGFQRIRDILRLPRKSLARRLGPALVHHLDRLCGLCPDPQHAWQPAASWSSRLELAAETTSSRALLFPLKRMVQELCGNLRAGDFGVQQLTVTLSLRHGEQSVHIGLQQPGRDAQQLMLLLRERLERLRLTSPARQVTLEAEQLLPFSAHQASLFNDQQDASDSALAPLLERLRARLGTAAVHGLMGVQDHRPEYSWRPRNLDEKASCTPMPQRPLWLYQAPQPCRINDYQVLAGPERIESGWWDGHDCRRDYFIVQDQRGSTLWAYHEYKPSPGWYLHGVFA